MRISDLSSDVCSSDLSHVRLSAWSARRIDRKATEEINEKNNAANDAGRYNKLLVDSKALAGIQSAISAARAFHYSRTLPWQDDGARLLQIGRTTVRGQVCQ